MDPGGSYGWRAGRHGGTPYGFGRRAERAAEQAQRRPLCVLLLPDRLEEMPLRDQVEDLLAAPGVVAVEPARIAYGAYLRLPPSVADGLAVTQARRLRLPGRPRAVAIFHPLQYPLARALISQHPDCELWYGRSARDEQPEEPSRRRRERIAELHEAAAHRAALTFVASEALAVLEREEGRQPVLVPGAADGFPAPDPRGALIAVCLAEPGLETDWALLRALAERMPDLVLLMVGPVEGDESDADYVACRVAPNLVWLGPRSDEDAARIVMCADVGLNPLAPSERNHPLLPTRILKYARLGRRTISTDLAGVRTWERAVTVADGVEAWSAALRDQAGARLRPDDDLREWALAQTARRQNRPLWERMERLGVESGRLGSERPDVMGRL